jgi:hypothetical protein
MRKNLDLFDGLEDETKQCGICKKHLPLYKFGTDGGAKYLRYECRDCAKQQSKILREIKKRTPTVSKDHICPICKRSAEEILENKTSKTNPWCLDHEHSTQKFRGYLCHKCNLALGNFSDDIERLYNAIIYLKETT